jgi:hypothetical protein
LIIKKIPTRRKITLTNSLRKKKKFEEIREQKLKELEHKREKSKQKIFNEMEHKKNIEKIKTENNKNINSSRSKSPSRIIKPFQQNNVNQNLQ